MFRREAESDRHIEVLKAPHLPIEPVQRIGAETIRPGKTCPDRFPSEPLHPGAPLVKSGIFEVEPLNQAEFRRMPGEAFEP